MSSSSEEVTHSESESSDAGESGDENDARATRGSLDVVGHAATPTARPTISPSRPSLRHNQNTDLSTGVEKFHHSEGRDRARAGAGQVV